MSRIRRKNEDRELQRILEVNPNLLPGDQIDPEDPRRWPVPIAGVSTFFHVRFSGGPRAGDSPGLPGKDSMSQMRRAELIDLDILMSWLRDSAECELWAGRRVSFPVDLAGLPEAIEWERADSWSATWNGALVAFGQIIPKSRRRLHLARLIVQPERRGQGLGRLLAAHLLEVALSRGPVRVSLNVAPGNVPAISLYRSLGFSETPRPDDEPESTSFYMERAV